ncbi:MAG TPA: S1/P1 nuclease [Longimicrobium sp.]|nr:S1/P1 nuclease [Longimicrobium sp.]
MKRVSVLLAAAAATAVFTAPAYAWDGFGHRIVAQIAWDNMTPAARANAIQLLRAASSNTRLLFPAQPGPLNDAQQQQQFLHASIWPDLIRGSSFDVPDRHFVNIFWRQQQDFSTPQPLPGHAVTGMLLNDLPRFATAVRNHQGSPAQRAIELAWIIHLVGDIHQPLHSSARVTPLDPNGDRGGGLFILAPEPHKVTLHNLWDQIVDRQEPRQGGETEDAYIRRLATAFEARFPRNSFGAEINVISPTRWAQRSVEIAQQAVYRSPLVRGQMPDVAGYQRPALAVAEPRIALAGYRLAELLNTILG